MLLLFEISIPKLLTFDKLLQNFIEAEKFFGPISACMAATLSHILMFKEKNSPPIVSSLAFSGFRTKKRSIESPDGGMGFRDG